MPFKICDCDKLLSNTPATQFWLEASLDQINLNFTALYTRRFIKKARECENLSRFFVGIEKFTFREMHVGKNSVEKSLFITLESANVAFVGRRSSISV